MFLSISNILFGEELRVSPCGGIAGNFCDHSVDKCKQAAAKLELYSGERIEAAKAQRKDEGEKGHEIIAWFRVKGTLKII